jgi:hypothetical protein
LCFRDLGHFWRRRKALERGPEDVAGVSGVVGRLIELGERERDAQRLHNRTYLAAVLSAIMFVTGVGQSASALSPEFLAQWAFLWRATIGRLISGLTGWVASLAVSR